MEALGQTTLLLMLIAYIAGLLTATVLLAPRSNRNVWTKLRRHAPHRSAGRPAGTAGVQARHGF